jgi:predicted RNase H-like nuclease (RuvC/YqgF family)
MSDEEKKDESEKEQEEKESSKEESEHEEESSEGENEEGTETSGDDAGMGQIKKLRKENAKRRTALKQLKVENEELRAKIDGMKGKDGGEGKKIESSDTPDALQIMNQRLIRAELKAAVLKAGLRDMDALRMFDTSGIKISKEGDVVGVKELVDEMLEEKEYLFDKETNDTTSGKKAPNAGKMSGKSALDMSDEEWSREKAKLGIDVDQYLN